MKVTKSQSHKVTSLVIFITIFSLIGCDAFVRKFTRKKERVEQETPVIAPEEYKGPQMTKEQLYRQHFLFWQSWHEELITSLDDSRSQKKILDCLKEAVKNLNNMRSMLDQAGQKKLDGYISDMNMLGDEIKRESYGSSNNKSCLQGAERLKMNIMRDFAYAKIKNNLI
ncbi:MAG: hypothetical protein ABSB18_05100 [Candidatus Omnitrophota bacterium]